MSTSELPSNGAAQPASSSSHGTLLATYVAAIFVSAALLFAVQPMFTKMVLPRLGGAAAVWSVAMVFFQITLLAGYAYAHLLTKLLPGRTSVIVHVIVMAAACLTLPLHIAAGWGQPPQGGQAFWLLGLFAASIGLPFFALSANGPLMQAWFVRTGHPDAKDPYFLYAASNVGSFLALIAYPVVVEPLVPLGSQTWLWTGGYYVLDRAGGSVRRADAALGEPAAGGGSVRRRGSRGSNLARRRHLGCADRGAVGSVDCSDGPHLNRCGCGPAVLDHTARDLSHDLCSGVHEQAAVSAFRGGHAAAGVRAVPGHCHADASDRFDRGAEILVHLSVFFICTLMCHGELARRRPPPRYLTGDYMAISFGGMVGEILTGLVAPFIFTRIIEYPLLVVLTLLLRPGLSLPARGSNQFILLVVLALVALFLFSLAAADMTVEATWFARSALESCSA